MDLDITRRQRDRLRRRTVVAAVGVGLICGAYLLPRVAQAVTRKADPLSLKAASKSTVSGKSSVATSFSGLKSVTAEPLILIPEQARRRTPHKPKPPKPPPYHREGPPPGLPFE
jgi:hypothetical protein